MSRRVVGERYELLELLGEGGVGRVYRARQIALDRLVAVKILQAQDVVSLARFEREAKVLAGLRHENIIEFLDYGVEEDRPYLVMELVEGRPLDQLFGKRRLELREVIPIVTGVSAALSFLHSHGILHRDVKPGNVMLITGGTVKLSDFGLARTVSAGSTVTQADMVVGSLAYMPPECFESLRQDPRADQYALAVMTYELLSGGFPYDVLPPRKDNRPRPLAPLRPDLSPGVIEVLERALALDPSQRFASIEEFRDALAAGTMPAASSRSPAREGRSSSALRADLPGAAPRSRRGALLALLCLGAAAGVGYFRFRKVPLAPQDSVSPSGAPSPDPGVQSALEAEKAIAEILRLCQVYAHDLDTRIPPENSFKVRPGALEKELRLPLHQAIAVGARMISSSSRHYLPDHSWLRLGEQLAGTATLMTMFIDQHQRNILSPMGRALLRRLKEELVQSRRELLRLVEITHPREATSRLPSSPGFEAFRSFLRVDISRLATDLYLRDLVSTPKLLEPDRVGRVRLEEQGWTHLDRLTLPARREPLLSAFMARRLVTAALECDHSLELDTEVPLEGRLTSARAMRRRAWTQLEVLLEGGMPPPMDAGDAEMRWALLVYASHLLHPPFDEGERQAHIVPLVVSFITGFPAHSPMPGFERNFIGRPLTPAWVLGDLAARCRRQGVDATALAPLTDVLSQLEKPEERK